MKTLCENLSIEFFKDMQKFLDLILYEIPPYSRLGKLLIGLIAKMNYSYDYH
jgi:hypothetical protein